MHTHANDNDTNDKLTMAIILLANQKLSIEGDQLTIPFERLQFLFDNVILTCRAWLQELEADHG